MAGTNVVSVFLDFWNPELTNEQKVPAIIHMIDRLEREYGYDFGYILPNENKKEADNG
jgi:hypothetical protein